MKRILFMAALALLTHVAWSQNNSAHSRSNTNFCPDGNHPHLIDLGLPSGTKWACCNVGASKPEDYGVFYAWGETQPKSDYGWSTYRWCNGSYDTLTKYNTSIFLFGDYDGLTQLELSDDAARASWGGPWRMPTIAELEELVNNCTYTWTTLNGVKGGKFTRNGKSIFLPAAGYRVGTSLVFHGWGGNYWSSSLDKKTPVNALLLVCVSNNACSLTDRKSYGNSVRPVANNNQRNGMTPAQPSTHTVPSALQRLMDNMVYIEGGTFQMGSNDSDASGVEKPVHQVTLSSYYIGKYEVTQEEWQAVMGRNPSKFTGDGRFPVEQVSWDDCQEFIRRLNQLTGQRFRLPTEAEWEFAARGGNIGKNSGHKYSGSGTIGSVAWYNDNSGNKPHQVGKKQSNELGLYDMSGNVWEWCQDYYSPYSSQTQTNPTGPASASYRLFRGSSWLNNAGVCRVSTRGFNVSSYRAYDVGLRLAR